MFNPADVEMVVGRDAPPLRWHGGVCVPHPDFVPFVLGILTSPDDDTLRKVFADRLTDCEGFTISPDFHKYLRERNGRFWLIRAGRHTSLLYTLSGMIWHDPQFLWLAYVRQSLVPDCYCRSPEGCLQSRERGVELVAHHGRWLCSRYFPSREERGGLL